MPDADQRVGLVVAHRHKRVVAVEVAERSADGVGQVSVVVERDQLRHDLGVLNARWSSSLTL